MTTGSGDAFEELLAFLRDNRGFDFTAYKRSSLQRRVHQRMQEVGVETYEDYLDFLQVHPHEFERLFNTILINVTSFLRDSETWDYLREHVVPRLLESKQRDEPIRVWTAGVASGEEAYSVAMVLAEAMGLPALERQVKIYATDVDEEALTAARAAVYSDRQTAHLGELRDRYFTARDNEYEIIKPIRRCVLFGRHDLLQDAPISRIDLLTCRNVLMYFNSEAQQAILRRFFFSLKPAGYLVLGRAETLLAHSRVFDPVNLSLRVFKKKPGGDARESQPFFTGRGGAGMSNNQDSKPDVQAVAFERDPLGQMLVNADRTVMSINARARELFGIGGASVGRPLQDLALSYRPVDLRSLIDDAQEEGRTVALRDVVWPDSTGRERWLDILVVPLSDESGRQLGAKIAFAEVTEQHHLAAELEEARRQLETALEELQSSNEELETTNEELQSTIEELETTNEELQSTNEELETMNEELQSTNEELETVNDELRERGDQVDDLNAFLESVLSSLQVGVLVVNRDLNVVAWNAGAEELWGVRANEAVGQHLLNLDIGVAVERLREPVRDCAQGRSEGYEAVVDAINRRGRSIRCRITCDPLRSSKRAVEGAILVMENLDERPSAEV